MRNTEDLSSYGAYVCFYPDYAGIQACHPMLDGRSRRFCSNPHPYGNPQPDPGQVRFARARFGTYDTIDFVVVLIGYALSGEPTLKAFYERLKPFAESFMALFDRSRLPDRSALSRFLAAVDQAAVEALRTLFLADVGARTPFATPGSLSDRQSNSWWVIDVDGTKQAARQRALPHRKDLPAPHRRMTQVCAPGYTGRQRGEVIRTRTTVLQAFTHQWIGTYGGESNGDYRAELKRALEAITWYALAHGLPLSQILVRLDGLYGNAAPLMTVVNAGLGVIGRSKDYGLLDREAVRACLAGSPDLECQHPESGACRSLYDCPDLSLTEVGPEVASDCCHPSCHLHQASDWRAAWRVGV